MMNGMFGGGMGFGWFFWIILLVLIIWAVVQFTNNGNRQNDGLKDGETPLDFLKKRYAKGEISKEEYETIKRNL